MLKTIHDAAWVRGGVGNKAFWVDTFTTWLVLGKLTFHDNWTNEYHRWPPRFQAVAGYFNTLEVCWLAPSASNHLPPSLESIDQGCWDLQGGRAVSLT